MRSLLAAVAVCSLLGLTACQSTDHHGHDHAVDGAKCCGTCQKTDAVKKECATCKAVGKENCATCKG